MKGYKGYEKGLICRGKQYAVGEVFEEDKAEICKSGMHFCENPLDILDYYPLIDANGNITEFTEVEALDEAKTDDGKKFCTKKLKIGAKLSLSEFIKASFDVTYKNIKVEAEKSSGAQIGGDCAKLAGGDYAKLAGGDCAKLAGGDCAKLAGGDYATLAGGSCATLAGGDYATLAGGNCAKLAGGDYAKLAGGSCATLAGGDYATLAGGDYAKLAGGDYALIVGGEESAAKGGIGSVILLVARACDGNITAYKAIKVDGKRYKADVYYMLGADGKVKVAE